MIRRSRNGRLPAAALCDLWHAPYQDRADAVASLFALNDAYRAAFGRDMCLSSGYRDLEEQAALPARKGGLAAAPGTSNHGWGPAVDLCPSTYSEEAETWLHEVGPVYGWANPSWAHRGGDGPYEPWHWEYTDAVTEIEARTGRRWCGGRPAASGTIRLPMVAVLAVVLGRLNEPSWKDSPVFT